MRESPRQTTPSQSKMKVFVRASRSVGSESFGAVAGSVVVMRGNGADEKVGRAGTEREGRKGWALVQ